MNISRAIYQCWIGKKTPYQPYQKKAMKTLKDLKPPEVFILKTELKILNSLNSDYLKIGKSLSRVRYDTRLSFQTIIPGLKELVENGLITSEMIKEPHKREMRISKLTDFGYKVLQQWKNIYLQV